MAARSTLRVFLGSALAGSLALGAAVLGQQALAAGLYRWVDAEGNVQFSDRPPADASAKDLNEPVGPSVEDMLAEEAANQAKAQREERARRLRAAVGASTKQAEDPGEAEPEEPIEITSRYSCEDARRFHDYYRARDEPQYRQTDGGGFRQLTAAELDAQVAQWQRAVDLLCREKGG